MTAIIQVSGLVKDFGSTRALDELDLSVEQGEVHGFLGPNGAGKSTTIRVLLGMLKATSGSVRVFGKDAYRDAVEIHRRLAYVPGDVNLWPNLSGGDVIDLMGSLRGGLDMKRKNDLIERFDLDPTKKCRTYSKGNRQKVALVSAFAADVDLYILDEPSSGLDPLMESHFQQCVTEVSNAGRTVLLSSHILAEVEHLCSRVSIVRRGKIVESGTLGEMRHLTLTTIDVVTARPITADNIDEVHDLEVDDTRARFKVDPADLDRVLRTLLDYGILSLSSSPPTLEELFLRHYSDVENADS
jgi:ABC-2 type transport system ATP-binding protein